MEETLKLSACICVCFPYGSISTKSRCGWQCCMLPKFEGLVNSSFQQFSRLPFKMMREWTTLVDRHTSQLVCAKLTLCLHSGFCLPYVPDVSAFLNAPGLVPSLPPFPLPTRGTLLCAQSAGRSLTASILLCGWDRNSARTLLLSLSLRSPWGTPVRVEMLW